MDENVISKISVEIADKGIWDKLNELYIKKSLSNRLMLLWTSFTYKMKEENLLKAHLNTFNMLLMKMKMVDLKLRKNK